MDNFSGQPEAAAAEADELELLDEELELELSDFAESDFFSVDPEELDESDELDEPEDSELFEEPLDELLAASRLSVR